MAVTLLSFANIVNFMKPINDYQNISTRAITLAVEKRTRRKESLRSLKINSKTAQLYKHARIVSLHKLDPKN